MGIYFGRMKISDKDRQLLALLRENARTPTSEMARRLGVSRTTVQSRLERLERDGVVTGYTLRLAPDYEGALIRAHVMLTVKPKLTAEVSHALRRIPEVRTLYSVSGSYDMVALVAAEGVEEMDRLIDAIGALDGVERTMSSVVLATKFSR